MENIIMKLKNRKIKIEKSFSGKCFIKVFGTKWKILDEQTEDRIIVNIKGNSILFLW